ncbi:MAG: hypothetical protein AAF799_30870 [Myxococcota bacterium]
MSPWWGLVAASVVLAPRPALAANTGRARVPPSFLGASCIETIDRSRDPEWSFDVGIPFESGAPGPDEPADSRTFQFFALCRSPGPLEELPSWVAAADVEAATEADPTLERPPSSEILEHSEAWAGCAHAITPVDARMPISCEATAAGEVWDTREVSAGSYVVWGHTYEPAENSWTSRDGVVRVIDGDDASAGPAVSISWPLTEVVAGLDEGITVSGCMAGMAGTAWSLSWVTAAELDARGDDAWEVFAEGVDQSEFEVVFVPPSSLEYQAVFLRAEARDPQGRSFVAYSPEPVVFLAGCASPEGGHRVSSDLCGVGSNPAPDVTVERGGRGCTESREDDDEDEPSTVPTGSPSEPAAAVGCQIDGAPRPLAWMALTLLLMGFRRTS